MQRLGRLAASTPKEADAEAFIGALPTLAAMLAPKAAPALLSSAPRLARGLSDATRALRAHPATRPMVAALRLQEQVLRGTPDTCAKTLAQEIMRALRESAAGG